MKSKRIILVLIFTLLVIFVWKYLGKGSQLMYELQFRTYKIALPINIIDFIDIEFPDVSYSDVSVELNSMDTIYTIRKEKVLYVIFPIDTLANYENTIRKSNTYISQYFNPMENVILYYDSPVNKVMGDWVVIYNDTLCRDCCGTQLNVSLDGIIWNYNFHFNVPKCINGKLLEVRNNWYLCISIATSPN